MAADRGTAGSVALRHCFFTEKEHEVASFAGLSARLFRYETGIEAIRLSNARGHVTVLPYMGQIVWDAVFDGVGLGMQSMFREPRPAKTIVETYGCLAYHCGMLRLGVPTEEDDHALHGEMPCAPMDRAGLAFGSDVQGPYLAVTGEREYAVGFGAHYLAAPRVVLRAGATSLDIEMQVENLSGAPMDLMYMCHANFAFAEGARIVQPARFTPQETVVRTLDPGHVVPTPAYRDFIAELAQDPARMETVAEPERYATEIVFYIRNARKGPDGLLHFLLRRREGDGFTVAYDPAVFSHNLRWVLANSDQRVCAFAMPATCEPEGYTVEKRKGNVRRLAGGAKASFVTHLGYADRGAAQAAETLIKAALG